MTRTFIGPVGSRRPQRLRTSAVIICAQRPPELSAGTYATATVSIGIRSTTIATASTEPAAEVMRTGDEFLITKHGRVVARLVAPEGAIPSAHGWMRGTVTFVGDPTDPDDAWSLGTSLFPRD